MRIRSITFFCNPGPEISTEILKKAGDFAAKARTAYQNAGIEVQTLRMATIPFPQIVPASQLVDYAIDLEGAVQSAGFDYLSLGPALPENISSYEAISGALAATQNTFFSGFLTGLTGDGARMISLPAVKACAQIIHEAASISADGFSNLRFAALANVPPNSPFFPAAYHDSSTPAFALALEAAELAVAATGQSATIQEVRQKLVAAVEADASKLEAVAGDLIKDTDVHFAGLDFSLAPFPEASRSSGTAIENLGVPAVGLAGSLAASALLTEALQRARFKQAGFNGLMLPVMEDATLAARAEQGLLSVYDLLMYSAVCGTGLDTIPLPGNTPKENLEAVLLDMAALALRLDKPLTARLMPIPGKTAGEATGFNFSYFANSRILSLAAAGLHGILGGNEEFELRRIRNRE